MQFKNYLEIGNVERNSQMQDKKWIKINYFISLLLEFQIIIVGGYESKGIYKQKRKMIIFFTRALLYK